MRYCVSIDSVERYGTLSYILVRYRTLYTRPDNVMVGHPTLSEEGDSITGIQALGVEWRLRNRPLLP